MESCSQEKSKTFDDQYNITPQCVLFACVGWSRNSNVILNRTCETGEGACILGSRGCIRICESQSSLVAADAMWRRCRVDDASMT